MGVSLPPCSLSCAHVVDLNPQAEGLSYRTSGTVTLADKPRTAMKTHTACSTIATMLLLSLLTANMAAAQLMSVCVENSPERRGEIGCSIIEKKALPVGLKEPAFWHIDRFDSPERAHAAVGPASVAFEAAGTPWLMTIESQTSDHHGGQHVAQVGPLPLPQAPQYAIQVQSAAFLPGMYSCSIIIPGWKRSM